MHAISRPPETHYSDDQFRTLQSPPEIVGYIKKTPADFKVAETLAFDLSGAGEHQYLNITKQDANTGWVAHKLAEFAGVSDSDVGYAGRKDRHAVTRQWFSCYLPGVADKDWQSFHEPGVQVNQVGRHGKKLRTGEITCNEFVIQVRHELISPKAREDLNRRLERLAKDGFPNYFGPQRFGRDGQNLQQADRLLREGMRVCGDRGMVISAARSWLFNLYLSDDVATGNPAFSSQGPLIGKSRDPQPGEESLPPILQEWVAGLRKLGAKVGQRALYVVPKVLQWDFQDDVTELKFQLPSGSYATSLLRELFLIEDAAL